jgi:hypothetical protein
LRLRPVDPASSGFWDRGTIQFVEPLLGIGVRDNIAGSSLRWAALGEKNLSGCLPGERSKRHVSNQLGPDRQSGLLPGHRKGDRRALVPILPVPTRLPSKSPGLGFSATNVKLSSF